MTQLPDLAASPAIVGVAVIGGGAHVLTGVGDPMNLDNMSCVSSTMFDVLKTPPLIGRTFDRDDDQPGAAPTVVLAYTFWQTLGGSTSILGTTLSINHTPVTVVGVMPRGYYGAFERADTMGWLPYHRPVVDAKNAGCGHFETETMIVRLRPGVTREHAATLIPGFSFSLVESGWMDSVRVPLKVLSAAVVCVLLIACLNVGGLQMERTLARRRELSLRLALGASRARLARQIVTENALFALLGAAAGLVATGLSIRGLVSLLPPNVPYMDEIVVNGRVLAGALVVAAVAGFVSGMFPLLETRRSTTPEALASTSARSTERRAHWTRRGLVVGQIAMSFVVLTGAGLMIQTFLTLRPTSPGFDPEHKLLQLASLRGATPEANALFYAALFERLRGAPDITAVAGTSYVPLVGRSGDAVVDPKGLRIHSLANVVTPNYFALMKIPIVSGRGFTAADSAGSAPVVIINEILARRINPSGAPGDVVGRRLTMDLTDNGVPDPLNERTIVGVLANTRGHGGDLRPSLEAYLPYTQNPAQRLALIVDYPPGGSAAAATAVRRAILDVRPDFVVTPPDDLRAEVNEPVATLRFGAFVLGLFGGMAALLAGIGLMTTIGWWVAQRTREFGVRMALGATGRQVTGLVARQGLALVALGLAVGCAIAALVTRYMATWIFGVTPLDPLTFVSAAVLMLLVAFAAIFFPTRRATRVNPVTALRAE